MVTSTIIIYALMTPVGSMLGVLLTNTNLSPVIREGSIVVLEGLAGGTLLNSLKFFHHSFLGTFIYGR
jgi:hypothetical protein